MRQHEEGNKFDLMKYRLETAKSDLKSAKILIEAEVKNTEPQTTGHTMPYSMQYQRFMLLMGKHTNGIKMRWEVLTGSM